MTNRSRSELTETVIAQALNYEGFRSRTNRVNDFGSFVGQNGKAWDGSFVDRVLFEAGVTIGVSFVSTTAALAYFIEQRRVHTKPRTGDIAIFSFPSGDSGFGQPHVGLVTDVSEYKSDAHFLTVEGMIDSGSPKGPQETDGVYVRTRFQSDVLTFVRPVFVDANAPREIRPASDTPTVQPSSFRRGRTNASTVHLQLALNFVLGPQNFTRGKFDAHTVSAVARFQAQVGVLPANGSPDEGTLDLLMRQTDGQFFLAR